VTHAPKPGHWTTPAPTVDPEAAAILDRLRRELARFMAGRRDRTLEVPPRLAQRRPR
jgi:hypothetical protein